mgnify:CR=1 FL=1
MAQTPPAATPPQFDSASLAALQWRNIGPFRGGRATAVAGIAEQPNMFFMGTTGGGVYKTVDGGMNWSPVTDRYFGGTIGAKLLYRGMRRD